MLFLNSGLKCNIVQKCSALRWHANDPGVAKMDAQDTDTPLHAAVRNGHLPTVKLLLQHGKQARRNCSFYVCINEKCKVFVSG